MPFDIGLSENRISSISRQLSDIFIAIERLEKSISTLGSAQDGPYIQSLLDASFEMGYSEGYDDGAEDAYNARLSDSIDRLENGKGEKHDLKEKK